MEVSLIVSTYNWKESLELYLETAFAQSRLPDEIVVADDGSGEDTRAMIDRMRLRSSVPIIHAWQEDRGFRLAAVRNLAVSKASGDYILITDGDLLLHRHFVADHVAAARRGCFAFGKRTMIKGRQSKRLLETRSTRIGLFSPGLTKRHNAIRSRPLAWLQNKITRKRRVIGCNLGVWRDDIIAVNGFNEAMVGWGREDREFCLRLHNLGRRDIALRYCAIVYHLYHPESSRNHIAANWAIYDETSERALTRCEEGIDRYFKQPRRAAA